MSQEVHIIKISDKYYIRTGNTYYIRFCNSSEIVTASNIIKSSSVYSTTSTSILKYQSWYVWQCMSNNHDFILCNSKANRVLNISGGLNATQASSNDGPKMIIYNTLSNSTGGATQNLATSVTNISNNEYFYSYVKNDKQYISNPTKNNWILGPGNPMKMMLNFDNPLQFLNKNKQIVDYPGNCITNIMNSNATYFTLFTHNNNKETTLGQYKFIRSNKPYYILSGTYTNNGTITNMCFDCINGKTSSGTKIQLYQYNGTEAQQWYIWKDNFNRFVFENVKSGLLLDIPDGHKLNSKSSNTQVQICNYRNKKKVHVNDIFSLTLATSQQNSKGNNTKAYYIRNTFQTSLNWVIAGLENKQGSAVSYHPFGSYNWIRFSTNGTTVVNLDEIVFEDTGIYSKSTTQTNIDTTDTTSTVEVKDIGSLTTPTVDITKLNIKTTNSESNNKKIASNIINNFFKLSNDMISKNHQVSFSYPSGVNRTMFNFKSEKISDTNKTIIDTLSFDFDDEYLFNYAKIFGQQEYSNRSLLEIITYFSDPTNISYTEKDDIIVEYNSNFLMTLDSDKQSNFVSTLLKLGINYNDLSLFGWNSLRPQDLIIEDRISYFNYKANLYINGVLKKYLKKQDINTKNLFLDMFLSKTDSKYDKILDYTIYTGIFAEILYKYDIDLLDYVPTATFQKNMNLGIPFWFNSSEYFTETDQKIPWCIINPTDSRSLLPNWSNCNQYFKNYKDYNNVFQVYNSKSNLLLPSENVSNPTSLFNSSANNVVNSHDLVTHIENYDNFNYKPIYAQFNNSLKINNYEPINTTSSSFKIDNYIIGERKQGCFYKEDAKNYWVVIGVTNDGENLKTNSNNKVLQVRGSKLEESSTINWQINSTFKLPKQIEMRIYESESDLNNNNYYDRIICDSYEIYYIPNFGGYDAEYIKKYVDGFGGKQSGKKMSDDNYGYFNAGNEDIYATIKHTGKKSNNFNISTYPTTFKINCDIFKGNSIKGSKNTYTINQNLKSMLNFDIIDNILFTDKLQKSDNKIDKDDWTYWSDKMWIKTKKGSYLKYIYNDNSSNMTMSNVNGFIGNVIKVKNGVSISNLSYYEGNVNNPTKTCDNSKTTLENDYNNKKACKNNTDLLARCFGLFTENKTIRLFDGRVDKFILDTLNKYVDIFNTDLENEILNMFNNNNTLDKFLPLLLPLRMLEDYIANSIAITSNNTLTTFNFIENPIIPFLIHTIQPIITEFTSYYASWPEFSTFNLSTSNSSLKNINNISFDEKNNYIIDKCYKEICECFNKIEENKAIYIEIELNFDSLTDYIKNTTTGVIPIQIYSSDIVDNKLSKAPRTDKGCITFVISFKELGTMGDFKPLTTTSLPKITSYREYLNINGSQTTDNKESTNNRIKFEYSNSPIYFYRQTNIANNTDSLINIEMNNDKNYICVSSSFSSKNKPDMSDL